MHKPAPLLEASARRVLLVRLRSIGDTVLMTPCLAALKRWQPALEIDVLTEALSAPVLERHPHVNQLFILPSGGTQREKLASRIGTVSQLRARRYDAVFNLHGGTTATFITRLAGARLSVGYQANQYARLLTARAPAPELVWQKAEIHCVEQQLALLKWVGVPVEPPPPLSLTVNPDADARVATLLAEAGLGGSFAVVHPAAAFPSKQWEAARFARVIDHVWSRYRLPAVVVTAPQERAVASAVSAAARTDTYTFTDLGLAELMALIARASLFVGNDSGPAHIAAAFAKPLVVIFGSSNARVWHPWALAPYRLLRTEMVCAPCPGYTCSEYPEPECIKRITTDEAIAAVDELMTI